MPTSVPLGEHFSKDFSKAKHTQHERQEVMWAALLDCVLSDKGISSSEVKNRMNEYSL